MLHNDTVYALDPGAAVDGESGPLSDTHQPLGVWVGDEEVIEVDGPIACGQEHLYRDCCCNAKYSTHLVV